MKKFTFLIGISGAGKSTYTQQMITNNTLYLSSDEIRKEMFTTLTEGNNHNTEIFNIMNDRALDCLKNTDNDVIYDATNLSRKKRTHLYNQIKRIPNTTVESRIIFRNPTTAIKQNNQRIGDAIVPENIIERQFMTLQIPRVGVDTDIISAEGESWFDVKTTDNINLLHNNTDVIETLMRLSTTKEISDIIALNYNQHDTPYHLESIDEHINMVVDETRKTKPEMLETAIFHDLGKGYVKNRGRNTGGKYINHDNVGAQLMLNYVLFNQLDKTTDNKLDDVELVYQHMVGHKLEELNLKTYTKKHQLSDLFLDNLIDFCTIDSKMRIQELQLPNEDIQL